MNLILALILIGIIIISWILIRIYNAGYSNGLKDTLNEKDNIVAMAEQRVRLLEYKLSLHKPVPGDTIYVHDYSTWPTSVRAAKCLTYDEETNYVTFKCYSDIYPLTGKYHNGTLVMLDYCQEC